MVLSVARMFGRVLFAVKYAAKEERFFAAFTAGAALILTGMVVYTLA
jgi:hypothetical protein